MKIIHILFFLVILFALPLNAQDKAYKTFTYKTVDTVDLVINVYYPPKYEKGQELPAIVFFFGGGWRIGDPSHFDPQCRALAADGMIALAADYRTESRHGTTPVESLKDAMSAMRWVRKNAGMLGIRPDMIAAGGGSAGGYLALVTATVKGINDDSDDLSVSPVPDALVLFNPVVKTWHGGYGDGRFGELSKQASPFEHISPGLPPTLIQHGTADKVVKFSDVKALCEKMKQAGDECTLIPYKGVGHGFFNTNREGGTYYRLTLAEAEKFLKQHGYINL